MMKRYVMSAALLVAGCTAITPLSQHGTLVLKPQFSEGQYGIKTLVPPYSQADINQLVLKIYTFDGTEHNQNIQRTLLNAQLDNPIVFSNLKPNTTYRIKAYAYTAGSLLISDDASSSTDIVLTSDDRPSVATLSVKLVDRAFNAQATSSIAINSGGYLPLGSTSMAVPGLEGIVTTFAGNGVAAFLDGVGTSASFFSPRDLAVDTLGNVYVADRDNQRIRKITPAGVVTTLAGNGTAGDVDGTASMLSMSVGVWVDANGVVYFSERDNNYIRKIVNGVVSTIAGCGVAGYSDGPGTAAKFYTPRGIAADASGNIFVSDSNNHCIRKVDTNRVVSTFAGNGTAGFADGTSNAALFYSPGDVAIDAQGNLFVADCGNNRIRKISPAGVVSTIAGNGFAGFSNGVGTNATLNNPFGVTVDTQGNVYFGEDGNNVVRMISPDGQVMPLAGNRAIGSANGTGYNASFYYPSGLALDSSGNLYVADHFNHLIRKIR